MLATAALLCAGLLAGGTGARGASTHFAVPADADQLIVVSAPSYHPTGSFATLRVFARANRWSPFRAIGRPETAEIGVSGLRDRRHEGDGSTPTGVYRIGATLYGIEPRPSGVAEAYHRLVCGDWWDEDPYSPTYNEFVHVPCGTTPAFAAWSEPLWTETVAYPYFAVVDFNTDPVVGGTDAPGSGIFLHSWIGEPTQGCVALPRSELLSVLRWLRPSAHPVIEIGTAAEIGAEPPPPAAITWSVARSPAGGYWLASSAGTVTGFGRAARLGGGSGGDLTAIAATGPGGYLLGTADGRILAVGTARFAGSPRRRGTVARVAAIATVPGGYLALLADGRVLAFGAARSLGLPLLDRPRLDTVALALTDRDRGEIVLERDGAVVAAGQVPGQVHRATRTCVLGRVDGTAIGLVVAPGVTDGYWVAWSDGGVECFGGAAPLGALSLEGTAPVVAITAYHHGYALYRAPDRRDAEPSVTYYLPGRA